MHLERYFGCQLAVAQYLDPVGILCDTSCYEGFQIHRAVAGFLYQAFQISQIQRDVLNAIDILETAFGQSALHRRLTTFKVAFFLGAAASLVTFVTTRGSAATTRAGAATNALA